MENEMTNKEVKKRESKVYTLDEIKDVAINYRNLKPIVANYLKQQFNLKKEEMAYYKAVQAMNYEYWRV